MRGPVLRRVFGLFLLGVAGCYLSLWTSWGRPGPAPPRPALSPSLSVARPDHLHPPSASSISLEQLPNATRRYLVEYGGFHAKQLAAGLVDSRVLVARVAERRKENGGYADRIKVAINVFLVALLTRRVFLLDWPDMEPFFHSPYFDWRYGPFNRTLERAPEKVMRDEFQERQWMKYVTRDLDSIFPQNQLVLNVLNVPIVHRLLNNSKYHLAFRAMDLLRPPQFVAGALQRALFQPTPLLRQHMQPYLDRLTGAPVVVGLHVRTDGEGRWRDPKRNSAASIACMLRCAAAVAGAAARPGSTPRFFLAADSQRVKDAARVRFGDSLVMCEGQPVHMDRSPRAQVLANLAFILTDHLLLSEHCTHLVLMHSGFGLSAGWRSLRPFVLHPYRDKTCSDTAGAWTSPSWCPTTYPKAYGLHFPYGRVLDPKLKYGWDDVLE